MNASYKFTCPNYDIDFLCSISDWDRMTYFFKHIISACRMAEKRGYNSENLQKIKQAVEGIRCFDENGNEYNLNREPINK